MTEQTQVLQASYVHGDADSDYQPRAVLLITLVAALGGLLFGYDTAVIAGAIGFLKLKFALTPAMTGWAASSGIVGGMIGAAIAGAISDKFGRRLALMLSALLFAVSGVGTALPQNLDQLVVFRILGGMGFGMASLVCPLYIAEIAPARVRGSLVSLNQLGIVTGILLVYFVNAQIAAYGDEAWNTTYGWRYMFGSEAIPSLVFLALLVLIPESPRWLVRQQRDAEAMRVLRRLNAAPAAQQELVDIKESMRAKEGTFRDLLRPAFRGTLLVAIVLAVLQQITGINAIMYYAPEIFKQTGAASASALMQTTIVGAVNFAFTFVAIWLIDKIGRKALLIGGAAGMSVSLGIVTYAFHTESFASPLVLVAILGFIACFAASLGPVVWVVIAEIFPNKIRGRAMSVATLALWIACYGVSQSFPVLVAALGPATTFALFMGFSIITVGFVHWFVPETNGQTLEAIGAHH